MRHRLSIAAWLAWLWLGGAAHAHAIYPAFDDFPIPASESTTLGSIRLAQAQPAPAPAAPAPGTLAAPAATQPAAADEPIGNVVTLTGNATVTRNNAATPLKLKDDIFQNDVLQTAVNSTLGVTFNDATTFNLTANAKITVDNYVYEDGGKQNAALFDIAKGTVAFVAASVAHTGDMKISTPTATLGIRGTTGLVEVPEGAAANNANNVAIKLYPDADGRVGRIEVNDRNGARLGFLTQGASGFTIRPGAGGRFSAAPLAISPQQALRDQGIVSQVHATQSVGRQIVSQQRALRQANPNRNNPRNNPNLRNNPARQPGQRRPNEQRPNEQRPNGLPQQQRPGLQRPGQPPAPGAPKREGEVQPGVQRPPTAPGVQRPNAPGVVQPGFQRPGAPNRPFLQRRPPAPPRAKPPPKERRR